MVSIYKQDKLMIVIVLFMFIGLHVAQAVVSGMKKAASLRARRYQRQHPIYSELIKLAPMLLLTVLLASFVYDSGH
mgnify:CR=1|jgi:hypothetical protein